MNDLNQLYQKLLKMDYKDFYKIETDFFIRLFSDFPESRLPWRNT